MGCSNSAYSNDEDRYVAQCKKLGVTPTSDLNPYGIHASWVKSKLEGSPASFEVFENLYQIGELIPKIRSVLGTLNYLEGKLDILQSEIRAQVCKPIEQQITEPELVVMVNPLKDVEDDAYTREHLIAICEAAVVPVEKWDNRDSPAAQEQVGKCCILLKASCPFEVHTQKHENLNSTDHTIWLTIDWPSFSSIEDTGAYGNSRAFYLPTPKRLRKNVGRDWY